MCDAKKIAKCVYDELHKFIQAAEKRFSWCSCLSRARGWRKIQIFFVSPHFEKRKFSSPLFTNERKFCERRERKLLTSNSHNNSLCVTFCGSLRVIKRVAPTTIAVAIHFPPRPRCLRFRHGLDPLLLLAQRNRICSQISASTRHRSISMSDFAPNRKNTFSDLSRCGRKSLQNNWSGWKIWQIFRSACCWFVITQTKLSSLTTAPYRRAIIWSVGLDFEWSGACGRPRNSHDAW